MKTAHLLISLLLLLEGTGFCDLHAASSQVAGFFPRTPAFSRINRMKLKNKRLLEIKKAERRKQERLYWLQRIETLSEFLGTDSLCGRNQKLFICWKLGRELSLCPYTHAESNFISRISGIIRIPEDLLREYMAFSSAFERISLSLDWNAYDKLLALKNEEERLYYYHAAHLHSWDARTLSEQIRKEAYRRANPLQRKEVLNHPLVLIDPVLMAEEFIKKSGKSISCSTMRKAGGNHYSSASDSETDSDPPLKYWV